MDFQKSIQVQNRTSAHACPWSSRRKRFPCCAKSFLSTFARWMRGRRRNVVSLPIPESHFDLIMRPVHGVLTTMMPDGQPQSSLVWCDYDGEYVCINTTRERQKGRNMLRNPRVSLLIVDPDNTGRYLELRGEVGISMDNVVKQLDQVT